MKQLKLFPDQPRLEHGGSLNCGKRKESRPLYFGRPIHLVLKSSGVDVVLENKAIVRRTIDEMCEKFVVKNFGIGVNTDHVHLHLQFPDRGTYNSWVRATTGVLARRVCDLEWKFVPYTRVETWGRDFARVQNYIRLNELEGNLILSGARAVSEIRVRALEWLGASAIVLSA